MISPYYRVVRLLFHVYYILELRYDSSGSSNVQGFKLPVIHVRMKARP